jgi:hypothetical protein
MAKQWLDKKDKNRTLSEMRIHSWAYLMRIGKWVFSPDGIKFNKKGKLVDGQHRLLALLESGIPKIKMLRVSGLSKEICKVLDQGRPRTVADAECIATGDTHVRQKIAILRTLFELEDHAPHMTLDLYHNLTNIVEAQHINKIIQKTRTKLSNPLVAALIFSRPINPTKIDALTNTLVRREAPENSTEGAILRLETDSKKGDKRKDLCRRYMRAIQNILTSNQALEILRDSKITGQGYEWIKAERKKRGLSISIIPKNYARKMGSLTIYLRPDKLKNGIIKPSSKNLN